MSDVEGVPIDRGRVLVVIPAFNEQDSVGQVVEEVQRAGFRSLVVDDGSSDRTALHAERSGAVVLRLPVNLGVGGALRCGFRYAVTHGYGVVVQCDADGQHDPSEIDALLGAMSESGADLVVGSRFAGGDAHDEVGFGRRLAMRFLARMASRRTGCVITDATSGFRAIGGPLLGTFAANYPHEYLSDTVEALARAGRLGSKISEVPVRMRPRAASVSTASSAAAVWYLVRVVAAVWVGNQRPMNRRVRITVWEREPA